MIGPHPTVCKSLASVISIRVWQEFGARAKTSLMSDVPGILECMGAGRPPATPRGQQTENGLKQTETPQPRLWGGWGLVLQRYEATSFSEYVRYGFRLDGPFRWPRAGIPASRRLGPWSSPASRGISHSRATKRAGPSAATPWTNRTYAHDANLHSVVVLEGAPSACSSGKCNLPSVN